MKMKLAPKFTVLILVLFYSIISTANNLNCQDIFSKNFIELYIQPTMVKYYTDPISGEVTITYGFDKQLQPLKKRFRISYTEEQKQRRDEKIRKCIEECSASVDGPGYELRQCISRCQNMLL